MHVLRAEEELARGAPDDRVYDLVLAVTGSAEAAGAALSARLLARLRSGDTPTLDTPSEQR